jgi:hypothetical protein
MDGEKDQAQEDKETQLYTYSFGRSPITMPPTGNVNLNRIDNDALQSDLLGFFSDPKNAQLVEANAKAATDIYSCVVSFNVFRIMQGRAHIKYDDPPEVRLQKTKFCYYPEQELRDMMLFTRTKEGEREFAQFLFEFNGDTFQKVGLSKIARIAELLYRSRFYGEEAANDVFVYGHFLDLKRSFQLMKEKIEVDFPEHRLISDEVWAAVCEENKKQE